MHGYTSTLNFAYGDLRLHKLSCMRPRKVTCLICSLVNVLLQVCFSSEKHPSSQ